MESPNVSDDNRFPNPKANATATTSTSGFTFSSTSSVSGISRPRFVKVRKPNNAPAFNPFRNGAAANAAFANPDFAAGIGDRFQNLKIGEDFDAARHGEFVFATNTSSRVDGNSVSEQMSKLKIVNEGGTGFNESDLRNDPRKKLNIKKGRGNNAATENSTHEVLCQLKNLNVNDSVGSNVRKSKLDAKPSLENVTTFGKYEMGAGLSEKFEKLNLVKEKKEDCAEPNLRDPFVEAIDRRGASGGGAQVISEDSGVSQSAASASSSMSFQPVGVSKNGGFVFTGKQDSSGLSSVEFKTPASKVGKEGKLKQKSSKMRMNRSRENLKHFSTTQRWHGHGEGFASKESVPQDQLQGSPMDVSPYQEKLAENERSRESSLTSDELCSVDKNPVVDDSATSSVDPIDEDLIAATESLNINKGDVAFRDTNPDQIRANSYVEIPKNESISGVETKSFKSANDQVDITSDAAGVSGETEAHIDRMVNVGSAMSSSRASESGFTFAAASSAEAQSCSPKRHHKKKNVGLDSHNYSPSIKVPYSSSTVAFTPFSGTSSLFALGQGLKPKVSPSQPKTSDSDENEKGLKETSASISAASVAAQEACEKWRLR